MEEVLVVQPRLLAVTMPQRWAKLLLALGALSKTSQLTVKPQVTRVSWGFAYWMRASVMFLSGLMGNKLPQ